MMMKTIRNLLGLAQREDATSGELAPSLPAAEAELAAAQEAAAAADAAYRTAMLTADNVALRKLRDDCTDAAIRIDRANELIKVLRERFSDAQAREEQARRVEVYQAAKRQAEEARSALIEMYPAFAGGLADLLRGVAEAEIAVANANADANLPRGAAPLQGVEHTVRDDVGTPEEILSEEDVVIWCRPGDLRHDSVGQEYVRFTGNRRGYVQSSNGPAEHLVPRTFTVTRYIPAYSADAPYALATTLNLPGLKAGDPAYFRPLDPRYDTLGPDKVLTRLAEGRSAGLAVAPTLPAEKVRHALVGTYDLEAETKPRKVLDIIAGKA